MRGGLLSLATNAANAANAECVGVEIMLKQ
jgi:hypothetical protein